MTRSDLGLGEVMSVPDVADRDAVGGLLKNVPKKPGVYGLVLSRPIGRLGGRSDIAYIGSSLRAIWGSW